MASLIYRSKFLLEVLDDFIEKGDSILEIGEGDGRNTKYLREHGYTNVTGIDKLQGTAIEDIEEKEYDVIFTMSTMFLIPPENNWVFEKIARMAKTYIITIEGETSRRSDTKEVWGRDYRLVFEPLGFRQIHAQSNAINKFGVLRVLKNEKSN